MAVRACMGRRSEEVRVGTKLQAVEAMPWIPCPDVCITTAGEERVNLDHGERRAQLSSLPELIIQKPLSDRI